MNNILEWLTSNPYLNINVLKTLTIILIAWIIRTVIVKVFLRRIEDVQSRYIWRKTSTYLITFIAFLLIGNLWFEGLKGLTTIIGFMSAGIAIALKDVFINLAGWVFIIWLRSFSVGDRIHIGD